MTVEDVIPDDMLAETELRGDRTLSNALKIHALSRRSFVAAGSSLVLVNSRGAFAQSSSQEEVAKIAISSAVSVRQFAIETSLEEINFNVDNFVEFDYQSRQQTFDSLRQLSSSLDIDSYVADLPKQMSINAGINFSEDAKRSVEFIVAALEGEGLPLVPEADAIEPIGVPSLPPEEADNDTDLKVVIDIFLESIGIGELGLLTQTISANPDLQQKFAELVQHISNKEWTLVAEAIEWILNTSVVADMVAGMPKSVKRKFLFRLALRAVPFVGWLYTAASIVIAIKSNYHRFSFA
tara:strand:+ start:3011 stop:3895 length:885 start_codon:yes stop_codon:yes gene_type:complete